MKKNKRILKIYTKHQSRCNGTYNSVPEIKLTGSWLKEWGFNDGETINVICSANKLVILIKGE